MTVELWANIVAGVLMPFIVSAIKGASWADASKVILSMAVSLILGAITAYIGGSVSWHIGAILANATAIFTEATLLYKIWFQGTKINATLTNFLVK